VLREAAFWRVTDLLTQSYALHQQRHGLGARILLRSAFETLATLIYLDLNMRAVIEDQLNFHKFSRLTTRQAAGSKNEPGRPVAVNVLTMLERITFNLIQIEGDPRQEPPVNVAWVGCCFWRAHPHPPPNTL
jgi:hypothetical protein